ncbi:MAG: hypothetical protein ABMB14_36265 [Myxococcota bacterium]
MHLIIPVSHLEADQGAIMAMRSRTDLVESLQRMGYDVLVLVGLTQYACRLRDGQPADSMPLLVEDDAAFLAAASGSLERALCASRPYVHSIFLGDGSFEIAGVIRDDGVRVRFGEYPSQFGPGSEGGVLLTEFQYVNLWSSIAKGLLDGLSQSS